MRKKFFAYLFIFILSFGLISCDSNANPSGDKPLVYVSFFPIYDLVHQVAGDTVEIRSFMPVGEDPHLWEPTAKDMKQLAKADVLFINGANLEPWVDNVRDNLPDLNIVNLSNKVNLISYKGASDLGDFQYMTKFDGSAGIRYKLEFGHTHENSMRVAFIRNDENLDRDDLLKKAKDVMVEKGEKIPQEDTISVEENKVYQLEMGHQSGRIYFEFEESADWYMVSDRISEKILSFKIMEGEDEVSCEDIVTSSTSQSDKITYDPHSWLSVKNAKIYVGTIKDELSKLYPENEKFYKKSSLKAQDSLTKIYSQYKEKFNSLDESAREFIVTHYAWEYLSKDFSLTQYPLQGLISMESPSLKTIKKAIDYAEKRGISTIFYENYMPPKSAQTLAEEINGKIVPLSSMEYMTSEDLDVPGIYNEIMEENLEKIYQSLKEAQ